MKLLIVLGVLVLLAGLSLILSAFHIHFPLVRLTFGLAIAWVGISLMLSAAGVQSRWMAFSSSEERVHFTSGSDTGVVFANDVVDVTDIKPGEDRKVSVVFSDVTLRYDPAKPLDIHSSTAFGKTTYPDGASIAFGERSLGGARASGERPAHLEIVTVFGNTRLVPVTPTIAPAPAQ